MSKLALHHSALLNGPFQPRKLNLLFVFQVNCPGCFIHGIPVVNQLIRQYDQQLGVLGLSTAFEDFDLNTSLNTERLLHKKEVVGETARFFSSHEEYLIPQIEFPLAFDELVPAKDFGTEENLNHMLQFIPNSEQLPLEEQTKLKKRIGEFYIGRGVVPRTFTLNQFKGTPSFVFFDDQFDILLSHFGGLDEHKLHDWLNEQLAALV